MLLFFKSRAGKDRYPNIPLTQTPIVNVAVLKTKYLRRSEIRVLFYT